MPAPGTGGVPRPQEPCRTDPMKPRERWGQVSIANAPAGHSAPMPMPRRAQRPDHRLLHDRARGADLHQQRHERIDNRVVRLDLPPDRRVHAGDAAFPGQPQQAELPYHRAEAGAGIPFDDAISLRDRRVPSCLAAVELRKTLEHHQKYGILCPMYNRHYGCAKTGRILPQHGAIDGSPGGTENTSIWCGNVAVRLRAEAEGSVFWKAYWCRRQVCSTPNHRRLAIPSRQFRGYLRSCS
jgi:hypothetical protein